MRVTTGVHLIDIRVHSKLMVLMIVISFRFLEVNLTLDKSLMSNHNLRMLKILSLYL